MKRIVSILLMAIATTAYSQIDTIHSWERIPGVYYEDTNWWDYYCYHAPCLYDGLKYNIVQRIPCGGELQETARYLFSDTTIKIIGIAGSVAFSVGPNTIDTALENRPHEFFRLYSADSSGMVLLRETCWDTATVRRRNSVGVWRVTRYNTTTMTDEHYYEEDIMDLYETYFDSPVTVKDSFYVSGTTYSNYKIPDTVVETVPGHGTFTYVFWHPAHPTTCYFASRFAHFLPNASDFVPRPNYFKKRHLNPVYGQPDGEWRYVPEAGEAPYDYYINIFPIIDTTYQGSIADMDTCRRPLYLRVEKISGDSVRLEWNSSDNDYEFSYSHRDDTLSGWTTVQCQNSFVELTGLDSVTWYVAKVRSVCDTNRVSEWSDYVSFYIPGDTNTTIVDPEDPQEGTYNMLENYIRIMPNPANDKVAVTSSYRIDCIEIFALDGKKVKQMQVDGLMSQIDVSDLVRGTYIIRTYTNHGVSSKRLVLR